MPKSPSLAVFFCLLSAACAGTSPSLQRAPEHGLSSVIVGGRFILPSGETRSGEMWINFEGEGERANGETYRLAIRPGQPLLYQVEPDSYHLTPTRSVFGTQQNLLRVDIDGRSYSAPFPRSILRKSVIVVKPSKIVCLGLIEVRVKAALPGRDPEVVVTLDDSMDTRQTLIQNMIHEMMDPEAPASYRNNAVDWSHALEQSLTDISIEAPPSKLYKQGTP